MKTHEVHGIIYEKDGKLNFKPETEYESKKRFCKLLQKRGI
jgi:hypothetical protein